MTKTLSLLITLLLLLSCSAGQVEETATTKWDEEGLKGKVKAVTTYFFVDSTPATENSNTAVIKNVEQFNENSKIVEEAYSVNSVIQRHILYTYNTNGDLALVAINNNGYNGKSDTATITTVYTYNDKELNTKIEEVHANITFTLIEKEYNEQGLLVHALKDDRSTEISYTYDNNNRLSEELRLYDRIVYEYDDNGKLVSCKTYENGSNSLLVTETFVYDSKGRLVKEALRDAEGSFSSLNYDIVMSYDDMNRLVEWRYIYINNGEEVPGNYSIYTFDEKGNMVERKEYRAYSSYPFISTYSYDEQGNWIEAVCDTDDGTETTKREIEYY